MSKITVPLPEDHPGPAVAMQMAASWAIAHLRGDHEASRTIMSDERTAGDIGKPEHLAVGYGFAVIALAKALDEVADAKAILRDLAAQAAIRSVELQEES